ncbi:sister chromatid cohesion 1 protein 1-like, partial [Phalaenopsis equestris]
MFYSHQLLARKAPLGQIWMAATLNNKIKRRNLEKLNIPLICEEILNPSIPMALRLSGILMGGVVNVYKRKVDFLYDDVNRFLEELNRVFKAKNAVDAGCKTQAKRRAQARSEAAITITDIDNFDVNMEQHTIHPPFFDVARFRKM